MYSRVSIIIFLFIQFTSYSQTWQRTSDFPGVERDDAVGFVIDNKGYVGTGLITGWQPVSDFYALDLNSGTWSQVASLPSGNERQYAVGFSGNGSGFVFGGVRGGTFLRDLWSYDPASDVWNLKTSLPSKSRAGSAGFVSGNKFYLLGGVDSTNTFLDEIWIYDIPTDNWQQAASSMPLPLWRAAATEYSGNGYILFGKGSTGKYSDRLYRYEPATNYWTLVSTFPGKGRTYSSLATMDENLVIFGGIDSSNTSYNDLWLYDFTGWIQKTSMPSAARRGGILIPHLWNLYYTTGIDHQNIRLKETWKLNDVTGIKEQEAGTFNVYPNPASDQIYIKTYSPCTIELIDQLGRLLKQIKIDGSETIDVTDLKPGIYLLKNAEHVMRISKL